MNIEQLGWNSGWAQRFETFLAEGLVPARVLRVDRGRCHLAAEDGAKIGEVSGRFRHETQDPAAFPAVGDWVACETHASEDTAAIHAVLPRASCFSRRAAGDRTEEQVLAANIDTVFLVSGLDGDWNARRIERYLAAAWESGATPVVVLNKADLCPEVEARVFETEAVAASVPVYAVSAATGAGLAELNRHLEPGRTVALLGSSGVGKSSLANAWLGGSRQSIGPVRESDHRGRHTTTHRELFVLPSGALLVDGPGLRELQLWAGEESLDAAFPDVEALAAACRFRDCAHDTEPGCAIREAIDRGALASERFTSWRKLAREVRSLEIRSDPKLALAEKRRWKTIGKALRARPAKGRW